MSSTDIISAQSTATVPEEFQDKLINALTHALLLQNNPPCVLRSPTGSGKTVMIAKVIERISARTPTVWFWFVPFVNLVQQTEATMAADAPTLHPVRLDKGRNQDPVNAMVILSTGAALAKGTSRRAGYADGLDDRQRSIAAFKALALANGLEIGVVIDEAHIAVESETEFGQLIRWIAPRRIIMATATPKDKRLSEFISAAGYDAIKPFTVSRKDVVDARLNKRYIESIVYDLRKSLQEIVDLQSTVIKQGVKRNQRLAHILQDLHIDIQPLLLVQVGNGEHTITQAREILMKVCGVPAGAIGEHSSDAPDPVLMAQIANDSTKSVLIFKQSAGTGFDAPRAFVLASTKPVNDPDFAMQFMGRVMRVHRAIRASFPKPKSIPAELDTAYIYLANAQAQQGFEEAVRASTSIKTDIEALSERLIARQTADGGVHYSNRPENNDPLFYETAAMGQGPSTETSPSQDLAAPGVRAVSPGHLPILQLGQTPELDIMSDPELDLPLWDAQTPTVQPRRKKPVTPQTIEAALSQMDHAGLRAYALDRAKFTANIPLALKTEQRPVMEDMASASRQAAARLVIEPEIERMALRIALGKVTESEIHKELQSGRETRKEVAIVIERKALAGAARQAMARLPQVEDADMRILIEVISSRMLQPLGQEFASIDEDERPSAQLMQRYARDCAHWVIIKSFDALSENLFESIAEQALLIDACALPDFMLFLNEMPLQTSRKNIYGVMPPAKANMGQMEQLAPMDVLSLLRPVTLEIDQQTWRMAEFDGSHAMDAEEIEFARALDDADFVQWWHRNPDRKPYSVRLVRGEHKNYFHPDFVVCLEHYPGDVALMRLVETKESLKDAARKAKRFSRHYGKVLFLTKDRTSLRWINDDGSLGGRVDTDELTAMRDWLCASRPSNQK